MTDTSHRCCVRVYNGSFTGHMCTKTAKFERDGKWYCGTHDPIAVSARDEKRSAAWQQKFDADKARRDAPAQKIAALESEIERLHTGWKEANLALFNCEMELGKKVEAIAELVGALKELVATFGEPAGMTREIIDDPEAFKHFMDLVEDRVADAVQNARAAITKHQQPPISEQSTTTTKE